jgi:hypothetical protein
VRAGDDGGEAGTREIAEVACGLVREAAAAGLAGAALAAGAHTVREAEAAAEPRGELVRRLAGSGRGVGRLGGRRRDQAEEEGSGGAEEERKASREEKLSSKDREPAASDREVVARRPAGSWCTWELHSKWGVLCAAPGYRWASLHGAKSVLAFPSPFSLLSVY